MNFKYTPARTVPLCERPSAAGNLADGITRTSPKGAIELLSRQTSSDDERNLPRAAVLLGGDGRFAAITVEVFAASRRSWRRSLLLRGGHHAGGLFTPTQKQRKKSLYIRLPPFSIAGALFGVDAPSQYLRRQALFKKKMEEK